MSEPEVPVEPYTMNYDGECPKCDALAGWTEPLYYDGRAFGGTEYLFITCKGCHYGVRLKTKDAA